MVWARLRHWTCSRYSNELSRIHTTAVTAASTQSWVTRSATPNQPAMSELRSWTTMSTPSPMRNGGARSNRVLRMVDAVAL